jgi:hypothetical protein
MKTFVKHYTISGTNWNAMIGLQRDLLHRFNARKFGKHRRGTVQAMGMEGTRLPSGNWRVSIQFATGVSRFCRVLDTRDMRWRRFERHGLADFGKHLRKCG